MLQNLGKHIGNRRSYWKSKVTVFLSPVDISPPPKKQKKKKMKKKKSQILAHT